MNRSLKFLFRVLFLAMFYVVGVVFRPFWLSEWGPYVLILLVWLMTTLAGGWGGKGKPYSISFGLICGSGIALVLLVALHTNAYVAIGVIIALLFLGIKTNFFARRNEQLRSDAIE